MEKKLMRVTCNPACGFIIQSHDEQEIIDVVKKHTKKAHNMTMTDAEVRKMMKAV